MVDPTLQMQLPAFLVILVILFFLWDKFRNVFKISPYRVKSNNLKYNRVRRINATYILIFIIFALMIISYTVYPQYYYLFLPLDVFHHPIINIIGLLILKAAVVWIVVAQLLIDKEIFTLFKQKQIESNLKGIEDDSTVTIVVKEKLTERENSLKGLLHYSEDLLKKGLIIVFLGIFVTITNVVGGILSFFAIIFYYNYNSPSE